MVDGVAYAYTYVLSFFDQSLELGHPSPSVLAGALGIAFFTGLEGWNLSRQIRKMRTGQSMPARLFICLAFFQPALAAYGTYGLERPSLALVGNGLALAPFFAAIALKLHRLGRFGPEEYQTAEVSAILAVTMFALPSAGVFLAFSALIACLMWGTCNEFRKSRMRGDVHIGLYAIWTASSVFWASYAFATKSYALGAITAVGLVPLVHAISEWRGLGPPRGDRTGENSASDPEPPPMMLAIASPAVAVIDPETFFEQALYERANKAIATNVSIVSEHRRLRAELRQVRTMARSLRITYK